MINIIITSYNEPKATLNAINSFLDQNIEENFKIIVCDPFIEVKEYLKKNIKDKRVGFFLDPGEGKSYALNLLFEKLYSQNKEDLFIFTDGDVYVSNNSIKKILEAFKNPKIGCVTCKPVSTDDKKTKYGYWSHLLFAGIDKTRKKLSNKEKFLECSGYLFAIRNGIIMNFPLDGSEDGIISYLIWKKGYKIKYLPKIEVYIKNPSNWKDWKNQKMRNIKGHENYSKLFPEMPRTKSLFNEIKEGAFFALTFPKNPKEFFWTCELYLARLYIYLMAFKELKRKKVYSDGWRENEIESTKPLD